MAHNTKNLELHIWDIPEDNKQAFDYLRAIGNNFEKIDENAGTSKQNVDNIQSDLNTAKGNIKVLQDQILDIDTEQDLQSKKIEQISQDLSIAQDNQKEHETKIQKLEEKVAMLENNQLKGVSDKAEAITITDSAKAYGKIKVEGNTKQDTEPTITNPAEMKNCNNAINIKIKNESEEKTITFPLKEGQVLRKLDYLSGDGIHRKIRQFGVNGTEKIFNAELTEKGKVLFNFSCVGVPGTSFGDSPIKCCNIFNKTQFKKWANLTATGTDGIATFKDQVKILCDNVFGIVTEDDLETRKTKVSNWIKQNNIILDIELEQETIEEYTEEQQNVYNELQNVLLYQGYNYISSEDEVSPIMQAIYVVDINSKFVEVTNQLSSINKLLSTQNTSAILLDNLEKDIEREVL